MAYNIALISGVQHSDLFLFCRLYSIINYHQILNIIPILYHKFLLLNY